MELKYLNNAIALVSMEETEGDEPYDVREIVERATAIKSPRDFIRFLEDTPGSFFAWEALPTRSGFTAIEELTDDHAPYVFKESLVDAVDRYFPEIDALDEVTIKTGALGKYVDDHEPLPLPGGSTSTTGIIDMKPMRRIRLASFEILVQNIQLLERYAAIANGQSSPRKIRRIEFDCPAGAQFIDTQLWGYKEYSIGFAQEMNCKELFTNEEWQKVRATLTAKGYDDFLRPTENTHDAVHRMTSIGVYPSTWDDQKIATDVFLAFLNAFSGDDERERALNQPFLVSYDEQGFHVRDNIAPISACYREVAYLAEANSLRLCAFCGRPLIADKSRGNEAMYCSGSCNTRASAQRRQTAYALAASGAPIEKAIERIGKRYEQSIRRWYEEAKDLLD